MLTRNICLPCLAYHASSDTGLLPLKQRITITPFAKCELHTFEADEAERQRLGDPVLGDVEASTR